MKLLRILDSSWDRVIHFDDTEGEAQARAQAQALFTRMLASGSTAFKVNRGEGRSDEKVNDFSALDQETIIVPRIVGG
jgi:hypothetical protein